MGDVGSWSQTNLTVPKDAPYLRVTVYVKSRGLRTCRGFVGITFKDKAGAPIGEESQICGGEHKPRLDETHGEREGAQGGADF